MGWGGGTTPNRAVPIALSLAAVFLGVWIAYARLSSRPIEPRISNVSLSRTGKWLAAGTSRGSITIQDRVNGAAPQHFDFSDGPLNDLQFSPDERVLAIAGRNLGLYDLDQHAPFRLLRSDGKNYGTVRFNPDGRTILVITGTSTIETIDTHTGAAQLMVCCSSIYGEVAFTPDGSCIVNAGHWPSLHNAHSGQLVVRLTANRQFDTFRPIAFDGARVLMGSQDGRVYAWDLETRQLVATSARHPEYVDTIAVLKNGSVAYAGFGHPLRVWNQRTGQEHSFPAARPASNLIFDGDAILFGTADGDIQSWNPETGQRQYSTQVRELF